MRNELFGWIWVFAALALGVVLGLKFQREDWLGGYSSFPRRMVRLAHVALAALALEFALRKRSIARQIGHQLKQVAGKLGENRGRDRA